MANGAETQALDSLLLKQQMEKNKLGGKHMKAVVDAYTAERELKLANDNHPRALNDLIRTEREKGAQSGTTPAAAAQPLPQLPEPAQMAGDDMGAGKTTTSLVDTPGKGASDAATATGTFDPTTPAGRQFIADSQAAAAGDPNKQVDVQTVMNRRQMSSPIFGPLNMFKHSATTTIMTRDVSVTPAQQHAMDQDEKRSNAAIFKTFTDTVPMEQVPDLARAADAFNKTGEIPEELASKLTSFPERKVQLAEESVELDRRRVRLEKERVVIARRGMNLEELERGRRFGFDVLRHQEEVRQNRIGNIFQDEAAQREQVRLGQAERLLSNNIRLDIDRVQTGEANSRANISHTNMATNAIVRGFDYEDQNQARATVMLALQKGDMESVREHRDKAAGLAERRQGHIEGVDAMRLGYEGRRVDLEELNGDRNWQKAQWFKGFEEAGLKLRQQELGLIVDKFDWAKQKFDNLSAAQTAQLSQRAAEFGLSVAEFEQMVVNTKRNHERNVGQDAIRNMVAVNQLKQGEKGLVLEEGMLALRRDMFTLDILKSMKELQSNPEDFTFSMAMGYSPESYGTDSQGKLQDDLKRFTDTVGGDFNLNEVSEAELAVLGSRIGHLMDGVLTDEIGETWYGGRKDLPSIMPKNEFITAMAIATGDVPTNPKTRKEAVTKLVKAGIMAQSELNGVKAVEDTKFRSYSRRAFGGYNTIRGSVVWEKALSEQGIDPGEMGVGGVRVNPQSAQQLMQQMMQIPEARGALEGIVGGK